jgi:transposase InsO family protein
MSRKGDCWDSAVAESFFGTLKTEQVNGADYSTRNQAKGNIMVYIEMFLTANGATLIRDT